MVSKPQMQAPYAGSVPDPDPTVRTVEQLQREIAATREILEARGKGDREVIETRLSGMDVAIKLLQTATDKIPSLVKDEVMQLKELHSERFSSLGTEIKTRFDGIDTQFNERDKRTEQLSLADKTAINAALAAQEKQAIAQNDNVAAANAKMEMNFSKLIDQGNALLLEVRRNTEAQINDLKTNMGMIAARLDKGEGRTSVSDPTVTDQIAKLTLAVQGLMVSGGKSEGQGVGQREIIAYVFAGATVLIALFWKH